jgi:hypothetical protein
MLGMKTHCEVLKLWPSLSELRRDLVAQGGTISPMGVVRWHQRDSIPAEWWFALEKAAARRGYPVTVSLLARIAEERRQKGAA